MAMQKVAVVVGVGPGVPLTYLSPSSTQNFQAPADFYVTLALSEILLLITALHFSGSIPIVLENNSCYYPVASGSVSWQPVPEFPGLCVIVFIIGGCVARRWGRYRQAIRS